MANLELKLAEAVTEGSHAWIPIVLPSHGHPAFYGDAVPEGRVHIRKMTIHEESILHSQGLSTWDRINTIIRNCLRLPAALPPGRLLTTDRHGILLYQRVFSYGSRYNFTYRCQHCRKESRASVDLTRDLIYNSPDDVESTMASQNRLDFKHQDPFPVMLDDAQTTAHVRFCRADDETEIFRRSKALPRRANDPSDPSYVSSFVNLLSDVESVSGWATLPVGKKELWVRQLTGADRTRITEERDLRETTVNTAIQTTCSQCGGEATIALPFDVEFFQPTSLRS